MKTTKRRCKHCSSKFLASQKEVKRGNAKFCSRRCFGAFRRVNNIPKEPNVICAYCNKPFYKNESKRKNSKHGVYFCCREHKDKGQGLESGIPEIQPPHYGENSGVRSYRTKALKHYPNECNRCSYSTVPAILVVHHKDLSRSNNSLDNLEILCPNCHALEHKFSLSS